MKRAFLLLTAFILPLAACAADTKPIEEVFERYWRTSAKKESAKAAADVLPADLEELKKAILPVFLANQAPKEKARQEVSALFFAKTVGKARESMSPVEVFAGFQRIVAATNPEMFDLLKDAKLSIVFVRTPSADEAEVHFQITIRGESEMEDEALVRKNGRWWIRLKDDPKDLAQQFKQLLAGAPPLAK
ncbi:MAG: hypothetical protein HZA93_22300 [Verrucomicrobia bacterium]|nr:hypothetical protein [Verrucomicrobiota bacterium]